MKIRFAIPYFILCFWLLLATAAMAHHGTFVSYDSSKPMTMKATVTEFRYTNPHIQLFFDVKDEKGEVIHWSAEGPDPAVLVAVGWGRKKTTAALSPGAEITITVAPARNGKPVGTMSKVLLANGDGVCGLGGGGEQPTNCK
jgi:Family of unknown function (DUF6152)